MTSLDDLTTMHAHYGAADATLAQTTAPGIPTGWSIVTRRWAYRYWDALIIPPIDGPLGWRLADPFAKSRRKAIRRAVTEIRTHLARLAAESTEEA